MKKVIVTLILGFFIGWIGKIGLDYEFFNEPENNNGPYILRVSYWAPGVGNDPFKLKKINGLVKINNKPIGEEISDSQCHSASLTIKEGSMGGIKVSIKTDLPSFQIVTISDFKNQTLFSMDRGHELFCNSEYDINFSYIMSAFPFLSKKVILNNLPETLNTLMFE